MVTGCYSLLPEMRVLPIFGQMGSSLNMPISPNNLLYHTITRSMMNQDYDSYELNPLDHTRIQPLMKEIKSKNLCFKFFISSVYWAPTPYEVVQKHNREIRRTIRSFFKEDIRMWFFIEKHQESNSWHRHILMEDAPTDKWKNPTSRMRNFLMEDPEVYFASTIGTGITSQQKMELLNRVFRVLPFIPNGKSGLDIRPIHNLEKLTAYCSKQFELELPSYEVLDPASSDIDPKHLIHYKQDGTSWKTRHEAVPPRNHHRLPRKTKKPVLAVTEPT